VSQTSTLDALQRTLAAEHAAIFVLAALSGRASALPPPTLHVLGPALDTAYGVHVERRDRLRVLVTEAGGTPVPSEPAYELPRPLTAPGQLKSEALGVERVCTTTYAALVAATSGAQRHFAISALAQSALSELDFGGVPQALPGQT
jgi:hypothetical protein